MRSFQPGGLATLPVMMCSKHGGQLNALLLNSRAHRVRLHRVNNGRLLRPLVYQLRKRASHQTMGSSTTTELGRDLRHNDLPL